MPTIKINLEELTFNNVYYADYQNGSDTTGIGTEELPYKTIPKALSMCLVDGDAIFVKGDHAVSSSISFNKNVSVIGDYFAYGSKITMSNYRLLVMPLNRTVKFYRLYLHQTAGRYEMFDGYVGSYSYKGKTHIYNCILHADTIDLNISEHLYLTEYICQNSIRIYRNTSIYNDSPANSQYTNTVTVSPGTFPISTINSSKTTCLDTVTIDSNFNILTGGAWENAGTGFNPNGSQANIGIYGGPYAFGEWGGYHFIYDNNTYKTYDVENETWITPIGSNTPTPEDYETYGMSSLEDVDFTTLTNPNNIVIKKYTTDLDEEPILNVTALPFNTALIFPDGDINISDVGTLNYVNLTATASGNGVVKVIVSFDSGVTWYGYDTVNEEFIEVTNLTEESEYTDILSYGMTTTELSSTGISKEEWENIRPHSLDLNKQVIRFAYLLSIQSATDDAYVDNIALNVDIKGTWSPAIYTDQFIYAYTNYKLNIKIKESGTYKINYYYRGPAVSTGVDSWNDLIDKPERFLPTLHTHSISDVFNLQTTLDNKSDITHTHDMLHTHTSKPALDLISVDTNTGDPLWRGVNWPGNVSAENIIDSFIKQYDTPDTYSGNENKLIKVKADRTGLEFVEIHTATNSTSEITGSQLARRYAILYGRD